MRGRKGWRGAGSCREGREGMGRGTKGRDRRCGQEQ